MRASALVAVTAAFRSARTSESERGRARKREKRGGGDVRGRKSESERGRAVTAATTAAATNLGPAADNHYGKDRRRRQY